MSDLTPIRKSAKTMSQEILDVCAGQNSQAAHNAMINAFTCHIAGLWYHSGKSLPDTMMDLEQSFEMIRLNVVDSWGEIAIKRPN